MDLPRLPLLNTSDLQLPRGEYQYTQPGLYYITAIYQSKYVKILSEASKINSGRHASSLGIIFTARVILNLKNVVGNTAASDPAMISSISFASLPLGNLGAPLEDNIVVADCDYQ